MARRQSTYRVSRFNSGHGLCGGEEFFFKSPRWTPPVIFRPRLNEVMKTATKIRRCRSLLRATMYNLTNIKDQHQHSDHVSPSLSLLSTILASLFTWRKMINTRNRDRVHWTTELQSSVTGNTTSFFFSTTLLRISILCTYYLTDLYISI